MCGLSESPTSCYSLPSALSLLQQIYCMHTFDIISIAAAVILLISWTKRVREWKTSKNAKVNLGQTAVAVVVERGSVMSSLDRQHTINDIQCTHRRGCRRDVCIWLLREGIALNLCYRGWKSNYLRANYKRALVPKINGWCATRDREPVKGLTWQRRRAERDELATSVPFLLGSSFLSSLFWTHSIHYKPSRLGNCTLYGVHYAVEGLVLQALLVSNVFVHNKEDRA